MTLPARRDGLPTLSLCVIARDEQDSLPRLLGSVQDAFDEVVLVDTGSRDHTIRVFEEWATGEQERAAARDESFQHVVERFQWRDDFAAARTYADSLAHGDVLSWADCDDTIRGALELRRIAGALSTDAAAAVVGYEYARDEHDQVVCYLRRERLVRRGAGEWYGRVHEAQHLHGRVVTIPPDRAEWVHHKSPEDAPASNRRNLRILRRWVKDEPDQPRQLMYLGTELMVRGQPRAAVPWLRRYLRLDTDWLEERAQVHRKLSQCLAALGDRDGAVRSAMTALELLPAWPDSYLTLAERAYEQGRHVNAAHWATLALNLGVPDTMLIIDPTQYTILPRVILAGANAAQGRLADAMTHAERVFQEHPGHPLLAAPYRQWRAQLKTTRTVESFLACADVLCAHDEQQKALGVLESVPYFAYQHPAVVTRRSVLRERVGMLTDPDEATGEHLVPDDQVVGLCDRLPRAQWLVDQLAELAELAEAA